MLIEADKIGEEDYDHQVPYRIGIDVFKGKRHPKDVDLVAEITKVLDARDLAIADTWHLHPLIEQAKTMPPEGQLFWINRYWRVELGKLNEPTFDVRSKLIDNVGCYDDYINLFRLNVVGFLHRRGEEEAEAAGVTVIDSVNESSTVEGETNGQSSQSD